MNNELLYILNPQRAFIHYMENGNDTGWIDEKDAERLHKAAKAYIKTHGWACNAERFEDAEQTLASILAEL